MKLCRFEREGEARIGLVAGDLVDLSSFIPDDMATLIAQFGAVRPRIESYLAGNPEKLELSTFRLLPPLSAPAKILCSGINYKGHFHENPKAVMPKSPFFFTKLPNTVIGHGDNIIKSDLTDQLDYEVELSVVIGKKMSRTAPADVMSSVFGYTILNDVSARDIQFTDNQITLGKNFDTFAPVGPWIVTADEIPHPEALCLRTLVNGKLLQDGSTSDWVYSLPKLLSSLTAIISLEPGDIVTTGTPAGVGYFQKPQVFLKPGDVVRLEVEGIGALVNKVVKG